MITIGVIIAAGGFADHQPLDPQQTLAAILYIMKDCDFFG